MGVLGAGEGVGTEKGRACVKYVCCIGEEGKGGLAERERERERERFLCCALSGVSVFEKAREMRNVNAPDTENDDFGT